MLDVLGGDNKLVYDGSKNPNLLKFNMENLSPGNEYGFSIVAYNFNGRGPASEIAYFKSCTAPSGQPVPEVVETTQTSVMFRWYPPADDGACPVESYELYLDDGNSGSFSLTDAALIENKPYLREHTVIFDIL